MCPKKLQGLSPNPMRGDNAALSHFHARNPRTRVKGKSRSVTIFCRAHESLPCVSKELSDHEKYEGQAGNGELHEVLVVLPCRAKSEVRGRRFRELWQVVLTKEG